MMTVTPAQPFSRTRVLVILTAILLLAAAFRIINLNARPIWTDEGATTYNLFNMPDLIQALATRDHHPPLYYLLMQVWVGLTGDSVFAMRVFSMLLGMLCVALMVPLTRYFLGPAPDSRTRWDRWTFIPITAALILTLSDPDIDLSQEVRFYTLRTLLVILSALFYLRWIRRPSIHRALPWIISNVALYHTNYQGAFIIFFEGLHALLFLRGSLRWRAIGWLMIATLCFMPWFITIGFNQRLNEQGLNSKLPNNLDTLVDLTYKFLGRQWPLMLGLMLCGLVTLRTVGDSLRPIRERLDWRSFDRTVFLVMWIGLTLGLSYLGNIWFSVLSPRRIMLLSPAIAMLVARGVSLFRWPTRILLLTVITVYGIFTLDDYYPKARWDIVGANMGRYALPGQMGLMEFYYDDVVLQYYAEHAMPPGTPIESLRLWRQYRAAEYPYGLVDRLAVHDTVWFAHWNTDQSGFTFLEQTGHVRTATLSMQHWDDIINVYRYDKLPPQPVVTFTNAVTLRHAQILPSVGRVDLWWGGAQTPAADYSVSVFLLDSTGALVAQQDGFPLDNARPMTSFQPGEVVYDPHALPAVAPGVYTVGVRLYTYWDGAVFPPVSAPPDETSFTLGEWVQPG
jgi:uncharacterized membrane protein